MGVGTRKRKALEVGEAPSSSAAPPKEKPAAAPATSLADSLKGALTDELQCTIWCVCHSAAVFQSHGAGRAPQPPAPLAPAPHHPLPRAEYFLTPSVLPSPAISLPFAACAASHSSAGHTASCAGTHFAGTASSSTRG